MDRSQSADANTLRRLVRLRVLLDEARVRTSDRSHIGRHVACVLLDGACELALELTARDRGVTLKNERFETAFSQLREKHGLPPIASWKGVRDLHNARNAAQHQGVPPDADELGTWLADAEHFISAVVAFGFDVALSEVRLADDSLDPYLRAVLVEAESAVAEDRAEDALRLTAKALDAARQRFREHRRGEDVWDAHPRLRFGRQVDSDTARAVARAEDLGEILPFAPDLGEYLWLDGRLNQMFGGVPVDDGDARRALAFVTEWTRRLEAYLQRYPTGALADYRRIARAPSSGRQGAGPSIRDVTVASGYEQDGRWFANVLVQLQDLPEHHHRWLELFNQDFGRDFASEPGAHWGPRKLGLQGEVIVSPPFDEVRDVVPEIKAAITRTNEAFAEWDREREQREKIADAVAEEYRGALVEASVEDRRLVADVSAVQRLDPPYQEWHTEIRVETLFSEDELPWLELVRMLNADGPARYSAAEGEVRFAAERVPLEEAVRALPAAAEAVLNDRRRRVVERERLDQTLADLQREVRGQLS